MRLIDADTLKFDIMCVYGSNPQYLNWLNHAPTVDAVPVKHGKWISNSPVTMRCNQCTYVASDWIVHAFHYCPSCGARMDEE